MVLLFSLVWTSKYFRLDSFVCWIGCRLVWPMGTVASKAHIDLVQNRNVYQTARQHIQEDSKHPHNRCDSLSSRILLEYQPAI